MANAQIPLSDTMEASNLFSNMASDILYGICLEHCSVDTATSIQHFYNHSASVDDTPLSEAPNKVKMQYVRVLPVPTDC